MSTKHPGHSENEAVAAGAEDAAERYDDFELRLRSLRPGSPPAEWVGETAAAMSAATPRRRSLILFTILGTAAAAAIAAGIWLHGQQPERHHVITQEQPGEAAPKLVPVRLAVTSRPPVDEGVVVRDGRVWRQFRHDAVDESWWSSGEGSRLIHLSLPREELILLPQETY